MHLEDDRVDLTIHILRRTTDEPDRPIQTYPAYGTTDRLGVLPLAGETLYFAGLHALIPQTWQRFTPIVRTATLAAPNQADMVWDNGAWGPVVAHLVDGRPWPGYSGSPVFMESLVPGPTSVVSVPMPQRWLNESVAVGGPGQADIGTLYQFHALLGVFVAMETAEIEEGAGAVQTGIGYVLPSEYLTELLEQPHVQDAIRRGAQQDGVRDLPEPGTS